MAMEDLMKELREATADYLEKAKRATEARNQETQSLNRLDAVQRAVDEEIATIKKEAPSPTDWWKENSPRGKKVVDRDLKEGIKGGPAIPLDEKFHDGTEG